MWDHGRLCHPKGWMTRARRGPGAGTGPPWGFRVPSSVQYTPSTQLLCWAPSQCHWRHHWLLRTLATLKQLTVSQGSDEFFTFPGGLCRDSGTLLLASVPRVAWRNPHMTSAEPGPTLLGVLTMLYLRSHQKRRGFKTGLQGLKCKVSTVSVAALCHLPSLRA